MLALTFAYQNGDNCSKKRIGWPIGWLSDNNAEDQMVSGWRRQRIDCRLLSDFQDQRDHQKYVLNTPYCLIVIRLVLTSGEAASLHHMTNNMNSNDGTYLRSSKPGRLFEGTDWLANRLAVWWECWGSDGEWLKTEENWLLVTVRLRGSKGSSEVRTQRYLLLNNQVNSIFTLPRTTWCLLRECIRGGYRQCLKPI